MIEEALSGVRQSLALDGYALKVTQSSEGAIEAIIEIGSDACAECLVPKHVLESIIGTALSEKGIRYTKLDIKMPVV